jgi:16S rRNA processing protein RimM
MIEIGRLVKAHGLQGEVKLRPHNAGSDTVRPGLSLRLEGAGEPRVAEILEARPHRGGILLRLSGVDSMTAAERLLGARVLVRTEDLPAPSDGEFYWFEVVGLAVVDETGRPLGRVTGILENAAHDVYVVRDGEREWLLPAVADMVLSIEPAAGRIVARPIEGLLEP